GASQVLVEECEVYDFHHNAIEAWRTSDLTLRRNYVHARAAGDLGWPSVFPGEGDTGFLIEETYQSVLENNVAEGVHQGFLVAGRWPKLSATERPLAPPVIGKNRMLGNVAMASGDGFVLESRCLGQSVCDAIRRVEDTELSENIALGGINGLLS